MKLRDTYRYFLKIDDEIVHVGITRDPVRREAAHQMRFPGSRLHQVGPATTHRKALEWERQEIAKRRRRGELLRNQQFQGDLKR